MPQLTPANYANQAPTSEDDYVPFGRASDDAIKTATMAQLAAYFQSLASLINSVDVYSSNQALTTEQFVEANSGSAIAFTLPASSLSAGRAFRIYNKGAGVLTITPNIGDTIKGAADLALSQYESAIVQADGLGDWAVFGGP